MRATEISQVFIPWLIERSDNHKKRQTGESTQWGTGENTNHNGEQVRAHKDNKGTCDTNKSMMSFGHQRPPMCQMVARSRDRTPPLRVGFQTAQRKLQKSIKGGWRGLR